MSKAAKKLLPQGLYQSLMIDRFYRWRLPEKQYRALRRRWYLANYRGATVEVGGLRYVLHPKETISRYFYEHEEFAAPIIKSLEILSQHCKSFIDIGANIGLVSVQVGRKTPLKGIAIEPSNANFQLLKQNLQMNHPENQIIPMNLALGDKQGKMSFFLSNDNSGDHRLTLHESEDRPSEVVTVETLDSLIASQTVLEAPYLIKMDVQGYEWHVLQGAKESLKKPLMIVMEIWPVGLQEAGSSLQDLDQLCRENGLKIYHIQISPSLQFVELENLQAILSAIPKEWGGHADVILSNLPIEASASPRISM